MTRGRANSSILLQHKDFVLDLWADRWSSEAIATRLEVERGVRVHPAYLRTFVAQFRDTDPRAAIRKRGKGAAHLRGSLNQHGGTAEGTGYRIVLEGEERRRWLAQAERRGMTIEALLAEVVQVIATDDLFTAVIDDGR